MAVDVNIIARANISGVHSVSMSATGSYTNAANLLQLSLRTRSIHHALCRTTNYIHRPIHTEERIQQSKR